MNSWPIELGLAWIEGDKVESWSSLIQPDPAWDIDDWSIASARVHKIPKDMIMKARTARDVAETALIMISGKHLVSDNPAFERFWMNKLLSTADAASPFIFNYELIAASACKNNPHALDHLYEKLERIKAPHRAGPDAERLAKGVLKGLEFVRSAEKHGSAGETRSKRRPNQQVGSLQDMSDEEREELAALLEAELKLLY
ncbi:MAG: hypothetical protein IKD58_00160 [Loktanella sp.]|nr:hypothetical protein [Loktanella sp.]